MNVPALSTLAVLLVSTLPVLAEGKPQGDWAERAALGYEKQAAEAQAKGDAESARIYARMAQIKRDAGAAAKNGQDFSWDEYHRLQGELNGKDRNKDGACAKDKKVRKEGPGDGFLKAAEEYQRLGQDAIKAGKANDANIYLELAEIKRAAAAAAVDGKDFDWTRYHELKGRLAK